MLIRKLETLSNMFIEVYSVTKVAYRVVVGNSIWGNNQGYCDINI